VPTINAFVAAFEGKSVQLHGIVEILLS